MSNIKTFFYHDKPLFGLDIGFSSIKVMQLEKPGHAGRHSVAGYGVTRFYPESIKEGVIVDPESIARTMQHLFQNTLVGNISTRRTAISVPASKTFTRTLALPKMSLDDIDAAIHLETEQYVPVPIDDLYVDYSIISESDQKMELLSVAVPKKIVDSYLTLTSLLGLEVVSIESTIGAAARLFVNSQHSNVPTILIDLGALSTDITIYDKSLVVTGTILAGGDSFSDSIAHKLNISKHDAQIIKTKYGLGYSQQQKEITESLAPTLEQLIKEIKRMIRYYEERREAKNKIDQVITMGGGAGIPGLSEYLTSNLRLPVRLCDPWEGLEWGSLGRPDQSDKSMYATVTGLAMTNPKELFL